MWSSLKEGVVRNVVFTDLRVAFFWFFLNANKQLLVGCLLRVTAGFGCAAPQDGLENWSGVSGVETGGVVIGFGCQVGGAGQWAGQWAGRASGWEPRHSNALCKASRLTLSFIVCQHALVCTATYMYVNIHTVHIYIHTHVRTGHF